MTMEDSIEYFFGLLKTIGVGQGSSGSTTIANAVMNTQLVRTRQQRNPSQAWDDVEFCARKGFGFWINRRCCAGSSAQQAACGLSKMLTALKNSLQRFCTALQDLVGWPA